MTPRTELRATYRLQLHAGFPFVAAEAIVPYLADLGVSHLYLSPIWAARPGSTHGYDVVDHARISPELGGREGFDALADRARAHGLGIILDCVPNHMGIGYDNPWWADMLRWGEASPYAAYFDVEWDALEPSLAGKVLLPVLGDHYGRCLDDGQLVPDIEGGRMVVRYHEHTVPIHPRDTAELLETAGRNTDAAVAATLNDLASLARQIARRRERVSRQRRRADRDRADQLDLQLATARQVPTVEAALRDALATFTPTRDDHRPADRLHRLLERQAYRLSYWRLAGEEINYRRFFDVNGLAGLRMEEPGLFDAVHRLVVELTAAGVVDGLRLDHIDGLYDPRTYLTRLRRATRRGDGTAPWLFVEKILGEHEELRRDWPVDGTTGYEVMALLHGVQVDPAACRPLLALYRSLTQPSAEFHAETVRAKYLMMSTALQAELNVLAMELNRIAKRSRRTRDFGRHALREALRNVVAHFPVYRTYFSGKRSAAADLAVIDDAIARARQAAGTPEIEIYDFVRDALRGEAGGAWSAVSAHLAGRFQQYTGPVTAKAVEDTTFYRWVPLASLNEVGSEP
ncbi:MAG: malto-oligosyltrehalose synthase, partial [Pseudomonadota bacterium]